MKEYDIYAIGNALVDTEIEVSDEDLTRFGIEKGFMTLVDEDRQVELTELLANHLTASRRASGGSACNTIIAASYFGAKTFYSGKCLVLITPDAERTMNTYLGISATIDAEQIHAPAVTNAKYAYLEGYLASSDVATDACLQIKALAKQAGTKVALTFSDPSMVNYCRDNLVKIIGDGVDLLFCNETEAMDFTGADNLEAAIAELKKIAGQFVLTQGADGALAFDGDSLHKIEAHSVQPKDSNGAGDLFAGAFLYAISHGHTFAEAGKLASLASAQLVTQFGPRLSPEQYDDIRSRSWG